MASHDITTDSGAEGITIHLVFCLPKRQNVALESWFKAAMQVDGLSQKMWMREPACGKDSSPSVKYATPSAFGVGPLQAMPKVGRPHHGVGAWPCLATIRGGVSGLLRLVGVWWHGWGIPLFDGPCKVWWRWNWGSIQSRLSPANGSNTFVGLPRPWYRVALRPKQGSSFASCQMCAECYMWCQARLTHFPGSDWGGTTRRIYSGADVNRRCDGW